MTHITGSLALAWGLLALAGPEFVILSYVVRVIPAGTAYAICMGLGAAGGVLVGIRVFSKPMKAIQGLCVALIIVGMVGIKATQ